MSAQTVTLKAAGLQTYYQTLLETSPGALLKANNTVINREGVIEPRRGFKQYTSESTNPVKNLFEYKKTIFKHQNNIISYDSGSGVFVDLDGTYTEYESGIRIKVAEAKSNLYFTTSSGVKKLSAKTSADFSIPNLVEDIGGPKAISGSLALTGASGYLDNNHSVNYRILYTYTDRNDNLIFGAPSAVMLIKNTSGGTRNVNVTFKLPYDVQPGYKVRLYRSELVDNSVLVNAVPSDELYQVKEYELTGPDITLGTITLTDTTSDDNLLAGVPLYTNQYSGEGILKSNEPPPAAKDIALFKGHMFFANTRTRHALEIKLNANVGFTLTIDSDNYVISAGASIEATAKSLVDAINANVNSKITAYYLSVFGEPEGKIYLQRQDLEDTTFSVSSTSGTSFTPDLSSATISKVEKVGHRLYYSKYQEHEAVPLLNFIDIGSKDQEIERIVSLRESLFIFKGDGIYRLAGDPGSNPTWDVGAFDNTSIIKAPDTAVTLGNQCYYFSNQGIMRLNESSLEPVSTPIKDKLVPFVTTNENLRTISFALGYETDNALLVWTCLTKNDTVATVCYRYHTVTQTWTEWKIAKTCGVVNQHLEKIFLGTHNITTSGIKYLVEIERKDFNRFDQADYELPSNLAFGSLNGNLIKPANFSNIAEGDVLSQEQYVTIYQFNSLLKKLDLDNGLSYNQFYEDFKLSNGGNLRSSMNSLVARLDLTDPSGGYGSVWTNPLTFEAIQTQFNLIINILNNVSTATFFTNYKESLGTLNFEAIVTEVNLSYQEATLNQEPSFIAGPLTIFKAIRTEIEYSPQHTGDPAGFKQFSTATFMFKRRSFYTASAGYNSDISDSYEEIKFTPNIAGTFGGTVWGEQVVFGGSGDQSQIRTYVPLKKQRGRFLGCKFSHAVALETFELYGLSLSFRTYTINNRDYR